MAFRAFTNVQNIRIILRDRKDFLDGHLTIEQKQYISTNFKPGTEVSHMISKNLGWNEQMMADFFSTRIAADITDIVLQAIAEGNIGIQDLRFSNDVCSMIEFVTFPDTLHTLRIKVDSAFFSIARQRDRGQSDTPFVASLARMKNLQDLTLIWGEEEYEMDPRAAAYTAKIFRAVQGASKLRRFDLQGEWVATRASIVDFVRQHASSLRQLILCKTWLMEGDLYGTLQDSGQGNWLGTLHDVAQLTNGYLEYLRVSSVAFESIEGVDDDVRFDSYTQSQWPHFTCATDFGPHFRLLPDTTEDEDRRVFEDDPSSHECSRDNLEA